MINLLKRFLNYITSPTQARIDITYYSPDKPQWCEYLLEQRRRERSMSCDEVVEAGEVVETVDAAKAVEAIAKRLAERRSALSGGRPMRIVAKGPQGRKTKES